MGPGQVGQQNWRNVGTTFGPAYVKHEQPETAAVGTLQQKQTTGAGPAPIRDEFLGKLPQRIGPGPGTGITGPPGQVSATGHQMSRAESMPVCHCFVIFFPVLSSSVGKRNIIVSWGLVQCMSGHVVNRNKLK